MSTMVRDVMTQPVVAVRREASFKEMAARLRQYRVSAFPVVDENHRVIGVVSEADLLAREALADQAAIPAAVTGILHHKDYQKAGIPACSPASASLASRSASDTTPITLRFSSMTGNALTRHSRSRAAISLKEASRRTATTSPLMTSRTLASIVVIPLVQVNRLGNEQ